MRYTWEADDIRGGRVVFTANASERLMLGYDASAEGGDRLIVSLSDGSVIAKGQTKEQLAAWLNKGGYTPAEVR